MTGNRLNVGRPQYPASIHKMTDLEMFEFGFVGICLVGFGLLPILDWKNSVFQTNETGIRRFNTFRKVQFSANWEDLKFATKRKEDSGAWVYVVSTSDSDLAIPDSRSLAELREVIKRSAPHVNFKAWKGS